MKNKIVIAGGTGFIGSYLKKKFSELDYQVLIISRSLGDIHWNDESAMIQALEGAKLLINLSGKSVNCRYNDANRREILLSRTATTHALGEAIQRCNIQPELWINSSTATIYRHALDRPMTEDDGELGKGFSVEVAKHWEQAFFGYRLEKTRQIALRMAIVLGRDGGVMKPFVNLVRFGLGGAQGSGKQMFSWIHIEDVFNMMRFFQAQPQLNGIFNCASPYPISNRMLMQTMRKVMGVRFGLPSPTWLLKPGALLIGTETELVLKSRWVIPQKAMDLGFKFRYPTIDDALKQILLK